MSALNNIPLDALNQFALVARNASFSKAAHLLDMQPSTLSRHIAALEKTLDLKLLQRTTRTVTLTQDGATLLERISPLLDSLGQITQEIAESKGAMVGRVRIATSSTMAEICIAPILPELRRRFPDIQVELILKPQITDMRVERVDFAVRAGHLEDQTQIARKIGTHEFQLYCAPSMAQAPVQRELTFDTAFPGSTRPALVCEDFFILRNLVIAGEGRAWMPVEFCMDAERRGELLRADPAQSARFDVYVAYPKGSLLTKRARAVMDMVIQHAKVTSSKVADLSRAIT
ncbi:MAG: LysR family transcriptional regulator [Planktotalea sp.]|uniref:LysR family transcriptional regulator n=1 Tax=Planktotalea sp. TaxID=2029877 RepID=UPI003C73775A